MTFQELHLLPQLLRAVGDMGYAAPSPIQAAAIPPVLKGRDLTGCAQTGTGKTAAFAIPILQYLQNRPSKHNPRPVRALVLTPTRELALQIKENFDLYGKYLPVRNTVIFGGVGQTPQVEALQKGVDVLVATPGRLNDLCNQGYIDLSHIEIFVLDEADRMLDMGFIHDVRRVIAKLPEKRQTLLFSATMPPEITALSKTILTNPVRVEAAPQSSTADTIEQRLYKVDKCNKKFLLRHILQDQSLDSVLVFTNTKHGADRVVKELGRAGIAALAIHGNKGQTARVRALDS
ncbi:MAG: DEAD/DEAH box helicase, partial [Oscillospiraceae bacterium]|nr:DEAD/DEAH box helicase [Oscillospiraceae bacterium]